MKRLSFDTVTYICTKPETPLSLLIRLLCIMSHTPFTGEL